MMETIILCLAMNIYFEARNQPLTGQIAVTQVVFNRMDDPRYPDDACGVITQGPTYPNSKIPIKHKCQFSWYCDGEPDDPSDLDAFRWAVEVVYKVIEGKAPDVTFGATHYHAIHVSPDWSHRATKTVKIGDHIFYQWPHDF
jgi:N-acetylmuramoyl-L-alanine amidase